MADFSSGVKRYIKGQTVITVFFPVNDQNVKDVCCYQCELFNRSTGKCLLTGKVSEYPSRHIGGECPLTFIDEEKEEE
jgi:hypothetical protein